MHIIGSILVGLMVFAFFMAVVIFGAVIFARAIEVLSKLFKVPEHHLGAIVFVLVLVALLACCFAYSIGSAILARIGL